MDTDAKELLDRLERYNLCTACQPDGYYDCMGCPYDGLYDCTDKLWGDICDRVCAILRENEEMRRILAYIATSTPPIRNLSGRWWKNYIRRKRGIKSHINEDGRNCAAIYLHIE